MADRKRASDDEEASSVNHSKKPKLIQTTRPLCQYGSKCYRKNPDHLRAYRHPTTEKKEEEADEDDESAPTDSSSTSSPVKPTAMKSSRSSVSLMELLELDDENLLSHLYGMKFPTDLYDFWKFCSSINKANPREPLKNFFNLELVGPFEILDNTLKSCNTLPNIHLHYRYYYDTPEFMTVIRTIDKKSQFHIGYYRDSPEEFPSFLASNNAGENHTFKICGENLFAAVHSYARHFLKSNDQSNVKTFLTDLETYAKKQKYPLEEITSKINARKKRVNCTLINSLGMVVPCENDIGYRPVPFTKDQFKKVCDKFCTSSSEDTRQTAEDDLQHVITCIQFANDECDYGEGLEFGLNLFLYGSSKLHSRILGLLPMAYKLLHRDLYAQIITDHFLSGRSNLIEELNEIEKNK